MRLSLLLSSLLLLASCKHPPKPPPNYPTPTSEPASQSASTSAPSPQEKLSFGVDPLTFLFDWTGDDQQDIELVQKRCQEKEWLACIILGLVSENKGEPLMAEGFYQRACAGGFLYGCTMLAILYDRASQGGQEDPRSRPLLLGSCEGGESLACIWSASFAEGDYIDTIQKKTDTLQEQECGKGDLDSCKFAFFASATEGATREQIEKTFQTWTGALQKACDAANPSACEQLANIYASEDPFGNPKDLAKSKSLWQKAEKLFQKKCDGGEADSCSHLAARYEVDTEEFGITKSETKTKSFYQKAAKLFQKKCDKGDAESCLELSWAYKDGLGVTADEAKAKKIKEDAFAAFKKSCTAGDAEGCLSLAYESSYDNTSLSVAAEFYQKACQAKRPEGCEGLARLLDERAENHADAQLLYQRAAYLYEEQCNDSKAGGCRSLISIISSQKAGYLSEEANAFIKKAKDILIAACEKNDARSCQEGGALLDPYTGTDPNLDQAFAMYDKAFSLVSQACEAGDAKSCYNLGAIYFYSQWTFTDLEKAKEAYHKACEAKYADACQEELRVIKASQPATKPSTKSAPAVPEIRVSSLTGNVTAQPPKGSPIALTTSSSFELGEALNTTFTVPEGASLVLQLPDDSALSLEPNTKIFLSDNERREVSLVYGTLSVQMNEKSIDRAGMQVRTIGWIIRGPQSAFTVTTAPLAGTLLWVERGLVYAGDERLELKSQIESAKAAIEAADQGKEPPKPTTESYYTKLEPKTAALLIPGAPLSLQPQKYTTQKERQEWLVLSQKGLEKTIGKSLPESLKTIKADLAQVETLIKEVAAYKEKNLADIEVLKEARAAKDQAKASELQAKITRQSRYLLGVKRSSHLASLESTLRLEGLLYLKETTPSAAVQKALTKEEKSVAALQQEVASAREKTQGLRTRTKIFGAATPAEE